MKIHWLFSPKKVNISPKSAKLAYIFYFLMGVITLKHHHSQKISLRRAIIVNLLKYKRFIIFYESGDHQKTSRGVNDSSLLIQFSNGKEWQSEGRVLSHQGYETDSRLEILTQAHVFIM
jgi:hypothetical protein